jgi:DNA-binding transcriptional LysR family regulator
LAAFHRLHPQLQIDLVINDQINDLIAERFDLAIRIGWLRDSNLRAARLGSFRQLLVATPAYLAEHGMPRRPEDVAMHGWIAMSALTTPLRWTFTRGRTRRTVRMRQVMQANNAAAIRALVLAGAGMSVLPDYLAQDDIQAGRLQVVLAQYQLVEGGIHAVYPDPQPPAKVRAFIDFMRDRLAKR